MKYLAAYLLIFANQIVAAPKIETPTFQVNELNLCVARAAKLMVRYTDLFDVGPSVKTIRIDEFSNTSPGTLNQTYAANVSLIHQQDIDFGVNKTRLHVTFSSPFICDNLKILQVQDLGVDTTDPLYLCLHDEEKLGPLQKVEDEAFKTHLDAMGEACKNVPYGPEKLKCSAAWHQTEEGKGLFDALKAAQNAVSDYNSACFAAHKQE